MRAAKPDSPRVAALVLVVDPTRRATRYMWAGNVAVDRARVAILDFDGLRALRPRVLERIIQRGALGDDEVSHGLVAFEASAPALAFGRSGDGTFPVFWGLDDEGEPAHLVVDFLVAGRRPISYADVEVDVSRLPGPLTHPVLAAADTTLTATREGEDLTIVHGGHRPELTLLDPATLAPVAHGWRASNTSYTFVGGLAGGRTRVVVRVGVEGP